MVVVQKVDVFAVSQIVVSSQSEDDLSTVVLEELLTTDGILLPAIVHYDVP